MLYALGDRRGAALGALYSVPLLIHGVGPFGWSSECNHGRNSVPLYVHELLEVLEVSEAL